METTLSYYPDLSPYEFLPSDVPMLNVGWLSKAYSFEIGDVPETVRAKLRSMCLEPANATRGIHPCEFCATPRSGPPEPMIIDVSGGTAMLGNAEIHVRGRNGDVYSAPTLIVHFIEAHRYVPPREFLDAVRWQDSGRDDLTDRLTD